MTRRSLILAGGGLKIAYQAGVLQVWLDEAGVEFDSADGTSAACRTLAMWTQGIVRTADRRQLAGVRSPQGHRLKAIDVNWPALVRLPVAESLLTYRRLQAEVPLHYLFNFRARRFREQVDAGARDARAWFRERGLLPATEPVSR